MKNVIIATTLSSLLFVSCAIVSPGEVGVKQRLGKLTPGVYGAGPIAFNPFITKVIITSIQTENLEITLNLPSKEGLSINSLISILYKIDKNKVPELIKDLGANYDGIIANIFRSASADVCAKFFAKDMHSGMRAQIENDIRNRMNEILEKRGIIIESVLMKSIKLPDGLASSIEQKLQAEQDALRMEFILNQAKSEAERKIIEAKGERDAQKILSEGLTDQVIKMRSIEAFKQLSSSPNSKIIITDGQTPLLINDK
jgi:prohibitin 1